MEREIKFQCPYCGKRMLVLPECLGAALSHDEPGPVSSAELRSDPRTLAEFSWTVRVMNRLAEMDFTPSSPLTALLDFTYPHHYKNVGPMTFGEIIAVLQAGAGYTLEEIKRTRLWWTASREYRSFIYSPKFEQIKNQYSPPNSTRMFSEWGEMRLAGEN